MAPHILKASSYVSYSIWNELNPRYSDDELFRYNLGKAYRGLDETLVSYHLFGDNFEEIVNRISQMFTQANGQISRPEGFSHLADLSSVLEIASNEDQYRWKFEMYETVFGSPFRLRDVMSTPYVWLESVVMALFKGESSRASEICAISIDISSDLTGFCAFNACIGNFEAAASSYKSFYQLGQMHGAEPLSALRGPLDLRTW